MKKLPAILVSLFLFPLISCLTPLSAQDGAMKLSGPRIGLTVITGEMADRLEKDYDALPVISQFGWQFEWRYFSVEEGPTGVVEIVPLIGGAEQGLFLPSISALIGLRSFKGTEIGIGPNLSVTGLGVVLAAGATKTVGKINMPVNFAVLPSEKGVRFSLLFGFNMAK